MSEPLLGDPNTATAEKKDTKKFQQGKKVKKGSSFATIELIEDKQCESAKPKSDVTSLNCAFMKPCVLCKRNHTLEECRRIKEKPHKERVEFLKKNGLCFDYLVKGHLSKDCKKRMMCDLSACYTSQRKTKMQKGRILRMEWTELSMKQKLSVCLHRSISGGRKWTAWRQELHRLSGVSVKICVRLWTHLISSAQDMDQLLT